MKLIQKHFDLPKKDAKDSLDCAANVLADLANNIDHKADRGRQKGNHNKEKADDKKYSKAWAYICNSLADNKIQELKLSIQLARPILAKVCPSL